MNGLSEVVLFAVVLAVNLFLLGAVLAGGLTLAFRFIENVAPRLRYSIAVAVFLLAVMLPLAATLKISVEEKPLLDAIAEPSRRKETSGNFAAQYNAINLKNAAIDLTATTEDESGDYLDRFVSFIADSAFGKFLFGLWITGIGFLVFREALGLRQIQKARKSWKPATATEKHLLLCPKTTRLYFAENQSPGTIGLLRPVIILPDRFSQALSIDARRFIVRHELSHARWRDPLVSFLLRLVRAVFWISPALWLLERLIDAEREAAADRAAIHSSRRVLEPEKAALNYADALLLAAKEFNSPDRQRQNRKIPAIGIGGGDGKSALEIRIRRLLSSNQTTQMHVASAVVAVLLTSVAASVMPRTGYAGKLRMRQNEIAAALRHSNNLSSEENRMRVSPADQADESLSEIVGGDNQNAFEKTTGIISDFSQREKNGKSSVNKISGSVQSPQISIENRNAAEGFSIDKTEDNDSRALAKTLSDEDARRTNDRLNQNQPPPARPLMEAETEMISGNPSDNPSRALNLTGNLSALKKLRTDLKSEDELVRQKAASELDQLSGSGNMLEPARELNRIPTRISNLKTPARAIQ